MQHLLYYLVEPNLLLRHPFRFQGTIDARPEPFVGGTYHLFRFIDGLFDGRGGPPISNILPQSRDDPPVWWVLTKALQFIIFKQIQDSRSVILV